MRTYEVEIVTVPRRDLAVTRFHVTNAGLRAMGDRMGAAFGAVAAHLARVGVSPEAPAVSWYEPTTDGFDVVAGFPVTVPFEAGDGVERLEIPETEAAHTTHVGSYEDLPAAYDALRAGVRSQGRTLCEGGPMWEEYWTGPETPTDETRTEVYWPVT